MALSSLNQGISLDWLCSEMLSNAVFVSYGSGASSAVRLLLKELVISKEANISAHLTTVYLGGPPLAPDRGLFGIAVFDPLPMVSLFWGCGSLHPQIQHMDSAFKMRLRISLPKMKLFDILWQSAAASAPTNIQLYSVLHPLPHNSFFI